MNKLLTLVVLTVLSVLMGCSCGDAPAHGMAWKDWMQPNGKVKVLSTIAMVDDLVKQVGGDYVDSAILIKGELDPHSYQLVKGDDEKFAFADLIFYNGLGLEHGPSWQNNLDQNNRAISLGGRLMDENPNLVLYYKGQIDPHIWTDVGLWSKTVPYIVEALSQKDPAHAATYEENGAKLVEALQGVDKQVKEKLYNIPEAKRYLVTSHDAFSYFARAYMAAPNEPDDVWRLRFVSPEGLAPESQISTTDIQAIIEHLKHYNIHVLFPESNVNRDSIRKIVQAAKEKGLTVKIAEVPLYADAMGKPDSNADSYIKMITHNADAMVAYFKENGK